MNKIFINNNQLAAANVILLSVALLAAGSSVQATPRGEEIFAQANPVKLASFLDDEKRAKREPLDESQQEKERGGWAFYFDNDLFASTGRDRDYTGGISLTLSGFQAVDYPVSVDPLLGTVNSWLNIDHNSDARLYSFEFGLTAFTPENIQATAPVFDDRPYASLVYISNTRQDINYQKRTSLISSLTIGALGLNVAGEFQNLIHKIVDSDEAQGWDNQISDGGEFTFRYSLSKQRVRWFDYSTNNFNYEIKTARTVNAGYLTDLTWSISGRFGKIRTPWSSFNPQNAAYAEKGLPLAELNEQPKNEFYFWTGMSIHLRAYNALLQGQFRDSVVTYDRDELNHVVGEIWMGVTTELDSGLRLSYFLRGQTSEIKSGPGSRRPVWGGIIVSRSII